MKVIQGISMTVYTAAYGTNEIYADVSRDWRWNMFPLESSKAKGNHLFSMCDSELLLSNCKQQCKEEDFINTT